MEENDVKQGCNKHGSCPRCKCRSDKKLNVYDWLEDLPESHNDTDFVEVQFKNTRKGYYRNSNKIEIEKGDIVAVESSPGHDIGEVTLTGRLVLIQMKKNNIKTDNPDIKRVYRKAKPNDIEKYEESKAKEHDTMLRARKIAEDLNLNMKIGDVEYQGDGNKAIFYYIADERVDFRQLIKVLAEAFRVRIEMKQIGARQEAGRIGGIGPCGRELCCSGWMTSFVSVATSAARYQDISLNPQKLAGQCAKLKCCLNYEVDAYVEAQKQLPSREAILITKDSEYYHFKTDIHRYMITYSTSKDFPANLITISSKRAFEIIALNKRGVKVDTLDVEVKQDAQVKDFSDVVGQDSLTRFDKSKKPNKNKKPRSPQDSDRQDNQERRVNKGGQNNNVQKPNNQNKPKDNRPKREVNPQQRSENHGNSENKNERVNNQKVKNSETHNSEKTNDSENSQNKNRNFRKMNKKYHNRDRRNNNENKEGNEKPKPSQD